MHCLSLDALVVLMHSLLLDVLRPVMHLLSMNEFCSLIH